MSTPSPVFDLDDARALDEALCGHAVAVLARLRKRGLPVRHVEILPLPVDRAALTADLLRWRRLRRSLRLWSAESTGRQAPVIGGLPEIEASIAELQARPAAETPRCLCLQIDRPTEARLEIELHSPQGAMPRLWRLRQIGPSDAPSLLLQEDGVLAPGSTTGTLLDLATRRCALRLAMEARRELHDLRGLQLERSNGGLAIVAADDHSDRTIDIEHLGARPAGLEIWSRFVLRENLREPLRPLSLDLWRRIFLPVIFETLTGLPQRATRERRMLPVDRVAGRLYFNANRLLATPMGNLLLRLAPLLDPSAGGQLLETIEAHNLDRPTLAGMRKLWALANGLRGVTRLLRRMLTGLSARSAVQYYRRHARAALSQASRDLRSIEDEALLDHLFQAQLRHREMLQQGLAHELLAGVTARLAPPPQTDSGKDPSPSADLLRRCSDLARQLQDPDGQLKHLTVERVEAEVPRDWRELLNQHGHRGLNELELAAPRLADHPEILLRAIERAATTGPIAQTAEPGPLARWLATVSQLRDWPGWAFAAGLQELRSLYLELGRRLHQRGLLSSARAVFWIDHECAQDLLLERRQDLQPVTQNMDLARRQAARHAGLQPDDLLRSDGVTDPCVTDDPPTERSVSGLGVGVVAVEAPLFVVQDPPQEPPVGSILVFEVFTAGHVPLLSGCAGLVVESGDGSSLAPLVARQLGLPALVGAIGARRVLLGARRVRLDTVAGLVCCVDETGCGS